MFSFWATISIMSLRAIPCIASQCTVTGLPNNTNNIDILCHPDKKITNSPHSGFLITYSLYQISTHCYSNCVNTSSPRPLLREKVLLALILHCCMALSVWHNSSAHQYKMMYPLETQLLANAQTKTFCSTSDTRVIAEGDYYCQRGLCRNWHKASTSFPAPKQWILIPLTSSTASLFAGYTSLQLQTDCRSHPPREEYPNIISC